MRIRMAQRILWLSVILLVCLSALGFRLYDLQIVRHEAYTQQAYSQRTQSLPLQMRRGRILDRNGIPLTNPESAYGVGIFPRLLGDADRAAAALGQVLTPAEVQEVMGHARQSAEPAWVLGGLTAPEAELVRGLNLSGVVVGSTGMRYGPDSLARHLVGYANDHGGQLGLEKAYEKELAGARVPYMVATFDGRNRLLFGDVRVVEPRTGKEPYDIHTTLDVGIQRAVEKEMDGTAHPLGGPLRAGVVVLDAKSGEPLALASRPNYDQTRLPKEQGVALRNRALTPYEPGSVFKTLVAAAALEEGLVSLDEEFTCRGEYQVGDVRFKDYGGESHGHLTFREALAHSCNVTFATVGYERLGADRMLAMAKRFGLGSPTGVLPEAEEAVGRLPVLQFGGDVAQFSFGQAGLMATPLQMARAYAAIVRDGMLPPARLVTAVKKPSGEMVAQPAAEGGRQVISRETARELQEALLAVTDPQGEGTGRAAWVPGDGAAGKTGTAEAGQGEHAWFVGWVPARNPRYVIAVMIEEGKEGGIYAAPLFRKIATALLQQ